MKKFAGNKALDVIKAQCASLGLDYNDTLHRAGHDYIVITSVKGDNYSGQVLYNTFNGKFFGTTPDGTQFDSNETEHEREEWFQALLSFFYIEFAA